MTDGRIRHRQGAVRVVNGVPYSNRESTLSLLPGAAVGRWLAANTGHLGGRLLDLGAGNQPFRPWYGPLVEQVVAIDVAPAPGLDVLSLANPLPFRADSFDSILCTSVLEHVDSAEAAVAEIARVLKPGGRLLITVPFLYPTHEAPYDFWRTTHHGLRSVLNRHGLEVDDLAAQGGPLLLVAHYAILAVVGALRALSGVLGPLRVITDNRVVSGVIAAPQELLRSRVPTKLTTLSRAASLGYMAAATKPCACSRTDSGEPTDCRREVTFTG
jgi:SAM-dependent methyltransferase